jgi:serine/threonine-protein kinase
VYQGIGGQEGIWAVGFDPSKRELLGEPFRVAMAGTGPTVSNDGTLAYEHVVGGRTELVWIHRDGTVRHAIGQPQNDMSSPAISPDGTRVAVVGSENGADSIWVHDATRGTKTRLTFGPTLVLDEPAWADDRRVGFARDWRMYTVTTDGGEPTPLVPPPGSSTNAVVPPLLTMSWARDGRTFTYSQFMPKTKSDIWMRQTGDADARPFLQTPFNEMSQTLSPDARYIAYLSDETGRNELFVRRFPDGGGRVQVSSNGATYPRWSARGDEIFFIEGHTLMAIPVRTAPELQIGTPQRLFDLEPSARARPYDTLDGRRFVVVRTVEPADAGVAIVQNWFEEFRRR